MGEGSYSSDTPPADTLSISMAASLVILAPLHLLQFIPCCLRLNSQKLGSAYATAPLKNFKGFPFTYRIKLKPLSLVFKTLCNEFDFISGTHLTWNLGPSLATWLASVPISSRNVFLPLVQFLQGPAHVSPLSEFFPSDSIQLPWALVGYYLILTEHTHTHTLFFTCMPIFLSRWYDFNQPIFTVHKPCMRP